MASEKGSSKADTLIKMVLVFFISLLSFSVGTFVGKQVSDSDHRRLALEGEYKGGSREVASADEPAEEGGDKISEKDVESLTEEFVNKEKGREPAAHGDAHEPEHAEEHAAPDASGYKAYKGKKEAGKPAEKDEHGHAADAAHKVANKVAEGHAPTDGRPEERKPNAVLPSVANSAIGKFSVQVASYADEKQAKDHAADLKGKGWTAFYLSANVKGHTWFRVLVGLFENPKSADEFRAQFEKDAGVKSAIVQKIVQ
jgi:cell division septation protein DedD